MADGVFLLQRTSKLGAIALMAMFLAAAAPAQPSQKSSSPFGDAQNKGPIEINADTLDVHQDQHIAVFTGSVVATQGNMTLKSDKMTVFYRDKNQPGAKPPVAAQPDAQAGMQRIQKIVVDGNVSISTPDETGRGHNGIYYADQKILRLFGDVVLTQGQNVLHGDGLEYDMNTGHSRIVSAASAAQVPGTVAQPGGGRVKGVFMPDDSK